MAQEVNGFGPPHALLSMDYQAVFAQGRKKLAQVLAMCLMVHTADQDVISKGKSGVRFFNCPVNVALEGAGRIAQTEGLALVLK
jgi:hypothetical protein